MPMKKIITQLTLSLVGICILSSAHASSTSACATNFSLLINNFSADQFVKMPDSGYSYLVAKGGNEINPGYSRELHFLYIPAGVNKLNNDFKILNKNSGCEITLKYSCEVSIWSGAAIIDGSVEYADCNAEKNTVQISKWGGANGNPRAVLAYTIY